MAEVIRDGRKETWSIDLTCSLCDCVFKAEWGDVIENPFPLTQPEKGKFFICCPQCKTVAYSDQCDPRATKVSEPEQAEPTAARTLSFMEKALRWVGIDVEDAPITNGRYR